MSDPLNETLFHLLERRFGRGQVKIVHDGEALSGRYQDTQITVDGQFKTVRRLKVLSSGEEYLVNCPFCQDTRQRLHINHRWGVPDEESGTRNLWLMHCMNEECQEKYDNQEALYDKLFTVGSHRGPMIVRKGVKPDDREAVTVELPGPHWRIDKLAKNVPGHKAVEYLRERGYDIEWLGQVFNVGYCPHSQYSLASDRIVIPIYQSEKLVGWQARLIGQWTKHGPPKYFSCPGMQRSKMCYNFDAAVKGPLKVIVEGPGDVWGYGVEAMGVIGKTMSIYMQNRLRCRCKPGDVVVIMLDPKQDAAAAARDRPHHIERLYSQLHDPLRARDTKIVRVYLPEESDPGSLSRAFMDKVLIKSAKEQGVVLPDCVGQYA